MDLQFQKKWELKYFETGEWQVIQERLNDLDQQSGKDHTYAPSRASLFRALALCDPGKVRLGIIGQDPYPNSLHATGLAFDIGSFVGRWPPTLTNLITEYTHDLGYPWPSSGDLSPWARGGVLLWNAYPTVQRGKPGSHHWSEWEPLTRGIIDRLASQGCVIVYLGRKAQSFAIPSYERQRQIFTSHPSPLGAKWGFLGSRIFTRVNQVLVRTNQDTIKWRLP